MLLAQIAPKLYDFFDIAESAKCHCMYSKSERCIFYCTGNEILIHLDTSFMLLAGLLPKICMFYDFTHDAQAAILKIA